LEENMRIVRPLFAGMALAIAGIMTFSMADAALAKTKRHQETFTAQSQPQVQSSEVHSGADRQLQGRFYKRHRTHKQKTENK
jgi:hypothetical protein